MMAEETGTEIDQTSQGASVMAIPEFCPRDGSIMQEGVKYGYDAWVCPSCTYWKLRT
jgi:hypothetical protein